MQTYRTKVELKSWSRMCARQSWSWKTGTWRWWCSLNAHKSIGFPPHNFNWTRNTILGIFYELNSECSFHIIPWRMNVKYGHDALFGKLSCTNVFFFSMINVLFMTYLDCVPNLCYTHLNVNIERMDEKKEQRKKNGKFLPFSARNKSFFFHSTFS